MRSLTQVFKRLFVYIHLLKEKVIIFKIIYWVVLFNTKIFIKKEVYGTQSHCSDNPYFEKKNRSKIIVKKEMQDTERYVMKYKSLLSASFNSVPFLRGNPSLTINCVH